MTYKHILDIAVCTKGVGAKPMHAADLVIGYQVIPAGGRRPIATLPYLDQAREQADYLEDLWDREMTIWAQYESGSVEEIVA